MTADSKGHIPPRKSRIDLKHIVKLKEEDGSDRFLKAGMPDFTRCDNTLITSKYTILNFLPINIRNQFRRFANMYFLIVGLVMWVGTKYPHLYSSAFGPFTTWGPIALFISISIIMEGKADKKRHVSDYKTNTFRCIVLENESTDTTPVSASVASQMSTSMANLNGKNRRSLAADDKTALHDIPWDDVDVRVHPSCRATHGSSSTTAIFRPIQRKDIRQGHLVLVRNREMIPADIVLLASSGDRGCAYIETSSIDGETNLKLRVSAKHKSDPGFSRSHETIEEAVKRIARFTALGCPNPSDRKDNIADLTTEPPNAHINTFSGLLSFPSNLIDSIDEETPDMVGDVTDAKFELPLGSDNLLLRGAVLRNTEWAIGIACFTGTDTKLSQNTIEAPSKFSQLDLLTNKCVIAVIFFQAACISYLSTLAVYINRRDIGYLWYLGRKIPEQTNSVWPYLSNLPAPDWATNGQNWIQYALTNITLLSYFVPLSMYFTLEVCNFFLMWIISVDVDIYDRTTDTRAEARSTTYTDLGQIQYIFSDKTGTLTQNIMRFKRCSVDGMIFGKPVEKSNPNDKRDDNDLKKSGFHPVRQVLVGQVNRSSDGTHLEATDAMTFNAELFLRVMSLCHTVVVEKDLDLKKDINVEETTREVNGQHQSNAAPDGAPFGFAYQAESPDEGALVSASSKTFGFQVVSRDSTGIQLKCTHPSLFYDSKVVQGLKTGKVDPSILANASASGKHVFDKPPTNETERIETWSVLAINKFDSTRKRMSILLRSPPEFGSCAMLLCKGADSAMLDPDVCSKSFWGGPDDRAEDSQWELARNVGIESHLGEFASEGLRTLVLGVRFLTDEQCEEWLNQFNAAATSIKGREEKLTAAAFEIERDLHIVGATAIEDKLQDGVPDTIATLEKAGIKLWVLTGDKRETAIEIGYSTHVLTPRMHLTQMADRGEEFVRAQCAMEFMRLVKAGKLPLYQRAAVDKKERKHPIRSAFAFLRNLFASLYTGLSRLFLNALRTISRMVMMKKLDKKKKGAEMEDSNPTEQNKMSDIVRRRNVRDRAEKILKEYGDILTPDNKEESVLSSDAIPKVFDRAQSAHEILDSIRSQGKLSEVDNRSTRLSQLTAQEITEKSNSPTIDDDVLSLMSFIPSESNKSRSDFDKKKRSMLERMFAVDRDVRKGRLVKHLKKEKRHEVLTGASSPANIVPSSDGPRALVIEGAALKHLQGDDELEELLFNIASHCESVIACRVTPRQKAQLVKLVRHHVVPEPVTLAIGDGANDVGMIHAAHCGIGISGKEGQQAVNASDFSIGQFRFLENLVLIHGRWDFQRTSTVVLYTFYKNAVIAGLLVLYNNETLFSGTSLFDQWIMAGFSFVCFFPILSIGMFDRNLEKDYIRRNPEVYKASQQNELITPRMVARWAVICLIHITILYYGQLPLLTLEGGGRTSAFSGLMWNKSSVGDGEVSDWQSAGTTMFTSMVLLMGYKVLYESRSIINGKLPVLLPWFKTISEGVINRIPYTWYCFLYGSLVLYALCLLFYEAMGQIGGVSVGTWFAMVGVTEHVFRMSNGTYVIILFIPIAAMAIDIAGKLFSSMFYPSQSQIHIELESKEFRNKRKKNGDDGNNQRSEGDREFEVAF